MEIHLNGQNGSFPGFLRNWRNRRNMSQLDLALSAGISQRHVSFLETGRSNPSRASIASLGIAMDMPAAEIDAMMSVAGYTAQRAWAGDADANLAAINQSIDHVLKGHNPYPAMSIDRIWTIQNANEAAAKFFAKLGGVGDPNMLRNVINPGAVREKLINWDECAAALLRLFELEVARRPNDKEAQSLLAEFMSRQDVATIMKKPMEGLPSPLITLQFQLDGQIVRLFSLIATIGLSHDARLDDIRIETLLPADDDARNWFDRNG